MDNSPFRQAKFLLSVASLKQLPSDQGAEVAFTGRSNAGKSSALNAITGVKGLARTSKTPGCTQLLNFFVLNENQRFVDLPGYGYAKVPASLKQRWQKVLEQYLTTRSSLRGLILVTDIRHALNPFDQQMLVWTSHHQLPVHILLTKADKLSRSAAKLAIKKIQDELNHIHPHASIQLFSAQNGLGIVEAQTHILKLLQNLSLVF